MEQVVAIAVVMMVPIEMEMTANITTHSTYLQDLIHYNSSFAYTLLYHPKLLLPILEDVQLEVLNHPSFKNKTSKVSLRKTMSIHTYIYCT